MTTAEAIARDEDYAKHNSSPEVHRYWREHRINTYPLLVAEVERLTKERDATVAVSNGWAEQVPPLRAAVEAARDYKDVQTPLRWNRLAAALAALDELRKEQV